MTARKRAARTFYNVADALIPPGDDGAIGAGDVDLMPGVEQRLAREGGGGLGRLRLLLALIEWLPVLTLRSRRSFSTLPRARRCEFLDGWQRSRWGARRRAFLRLRGLIEEGFREAGKADDEGGRVRF
jgi:hypothetical protein